MKRRLAVAVVATLAAAPVFAQLATGDIAFTAFNADEDGLAFVTFVDLAPNTVIHFQDNEWTGAGFNTGESAYTWNSGGSLINAGTVIRLAAIDTASRSASVGTVTAADTTNLGFSATSEIVYAFTGASHTSVTTFLTALATGSSGLTSDGASTAGTPLAGGVNSIVLTPSTDFGQYTGLRAGAASFADYRAQVNNPVNWFIDTTNDYSATAPNTAAFTVTPIPEPGTWAMMLAGLGLIGTLVARRRGER